MFDYFFLVIFTVNIDIWYENNFKNWILQTTYVCILLQNHLRDFDVSHRMAICMGFHDILVF